MTAPHRTARRALLSPVTVTTVLAWALLLGLLPRVAEGAPLPPAPSVPLAADSDWTDVEGRVLVAHLVTLGVNREEAVARVAALSDDERRAMVDRLAEIGAGGNLAAVLSVAIILGLVVVLVLELLGRRVISRP